MSRIRLSFLAATLVVAGLASPASAQHDFGSVELGEIRTECNTLCYGGGCIASGTVESLEIGPPFFVRRIRRGIGADDLCNDPSASSAAELPVTLAVGEALVFDVDLVATSQGSHQEPLLVGGTPFAARRAEVVPAGPCPVSESEALCLRDGRFTVRSTWRTVLATRGASGKVPGVSSQDSGLLYFFNPSNWEVLLKVLYGCPVNDRFWVFAAATTNVEYTITVTDTQEQVSRSYFNRLDKAAEPIQDTGAFATCP